MNFGVILYTLGWVLNFEAAGFLLPLLCAVFYGEPYKLLFVTCSAICLFFGVLLTYKPPKSKYMYAKEGYITVALSWIVMCIFGSLPFLVSDFIPTFADALFETVSGFTTTGASILTDVEALPKCMLFWRSFTHWIGGMGVLVFLVAILPLSGGNNFHLIKAESPGPAVSKIVPKVKENAKILYGIYIFFTILEVIFLLVGGMTVFEALTLSFGTAGTGGFGIRNTSIAEYSPYIQNVITVFMIIFGVDFSLYYLILMRKFKSVLRSDELRAYLGVILAAAVVIAFNCRGMFSSLGESLHHSFFQVASIITTTGYSTADFDLWPQLSKMVLLGLLFMGACAGSTGGGIKVSRILILLKSVVKEVKIAAHPKSTHKILMNGRTVEHETVRAINVYMAAYIAVFAVSLLLVSIDGYDFTTSFTAVATAIGNVVPGFAKVGPACNFSIFSDLSTFVLAFDMLAGRLEIIPMLVLLSPYTWKK